MEEKQLGLRMYFLVTSSLMGILKGVACGHAALEYALRFGQTELFIDFATNWKTWIILDGGTTNDRREFDMVALGSLNQIADSLQDNDIQFAYFQEPDLNDALTAVCFIADERVFNKKDYPDFKEFIIEKLKDIGGKSSDFLLIRTTPIDDVKEEYDDQYKEWIRLIGGKKNEFLRDLIKDKKLA